MSTAWWLPVDGLVLGVSVNEEGAVRFEDHEAVAGREIARRAAVVLDFAMPDDRNHRSRFYCRFEYFDRLGRARFGTKHALR
jgi:hypothetical protein